MFKRITENARSALSSQVAWLLLRDKDLLISEAIDCDTPEHAEQFLAAIEEKYPDGVFPLAMGDNMLADVLLRNVPLVGLEIEKLGTTKGGQSLIDALAVLKLAYVTLIPLRYDDVVSGVLILGDREDSFLRSEHGQNLIKVLRRQISLEISHAELRAKVQNLENKGEKQHTIYSGILQTIDDGVLILDEDQIIVFANRRFSKMTGYKAMQVIGETTDAFIIPGAHSEDDAHYLRKQSGKLLPVVLRSVPVDLEFSGRKVKRVLLLQDRTLIQRHERALENQTKRLKTLNQASRAINSPIALQDVIQVVLSSAHEVVNAEAAALMLRDDEDDLIVVATRGVPEMHGRAVTMGMGIVGWVAQNAESVLVQDVEEDPRYRSFVDSSPSVNTHSMIAVPLITTSEVIGVLVVMNRADGDFAQDDLEILENLGAAAATAIENATLFDQTNRRLTELSTMLDASAMVTSTMDLKVIVEHISRRLREALGVHRVSIWTKDDENLTKLVSVVDVGWEPENAPVIPLNRVPSKAKALKKPTRLALEGSQLTEEEAAELQLRGVGHSMNVALRFNNKTAGIITLYGNNSFSSGHAVATQKAVEVWEKKIVMPAEELSQLCHHILQGTQADWCSVFLLNNTKDKLYLLREVGTAYWEPETGLSIAVRALANAETSLKTGDIVVQRHTDTADAPFPLYRSLLGTIDMMLAPIVRHGATVGLIEVDAATVHDFDDSMMSLTRGIANIIGNAIESSNLYRSLEQRAEALEAAYHELEEADRLKDELLQNMSHELGTPLTHILGYLSLLEDNAFGPINEQQRDILSQSVNKTQHVADLVKQMVVVHASNSVNLSLKETKLEQLAALAVRTLSPRAQDRSIAILPKISRNLPSVMVDQVAMSEVFEALIDNAIKFSHEGTEVEVEIRDTGGMMLQVAIRDHGIGIPDNELDKVFRQFYQIDGSTTRTYGGLGLGLAIVRKIVQAHGGKVWLESTLGEGTTVHFTVPKVSTAVSAAQNVFAMT